MSGAVLGIVWLVREMSGDRGFGGRPEPDPLELLDRRLAEGTVSPEDYPAPPARRPSRAAQPTEVPS